VSYRLLSNLIKPKENSTSKSDKACRDANKAMVGCHTPNKYSNWSK